MRRITLPAVAGVAVTLLFALPATVIHSRAQAPQQAADLTPLLAKPTSEMRLVVTRYNADRSTLIGHFAGQSGRGGGGGGGRAGGGGAAGTPAAAPPPAPVPISAARLARLKRYDLDWQAALKKIDPTKLSGACQAGSRRAERGRREQPEADRSRRPDTRASVSPRSPVSTPTATRCAPGRCERASLASGRSRPR